LAIFRGSGKLPAWKEWFIIADNGSAIGSMQLLSTQVGILSIPELVLFFRQLAVFITSVGVLKKNANESDGESFFS